MSCEENIVDMLTKSHPSIVTQQESARTKITIRSMKMSPTGESTMLPHQQHVSTMSASCQRAIPALGSRQQSSPGMSTSQQNITTTQTVDRNNNHTSSAKLPRLIKNLLPFFSPTSKLSERTPRFMKQCEDAEGAVHKKAIFSTFHQTRIIGGLFRDFIERKHVSLSQLVADVLAYGKYLQSDPDAEPSTATALHPAIDSGYDLLLYAIISLYCDLYREGSCTYSDDVISSHVTSLLQMLWVFTESFHFLYLSAGEMNSTHQTAALSNVDFLLRYGFPLRVQLPPHPDDASRDMFSLSDAPFPCGESPLVDACRRRNAPLVLLLLRHGACTATSWLFYRNALELLFFSPNTVDVSDEDQQDIERCAVYYQRAVCKVDVAHMVELQQDGRCALHPHWQQVVHKEQYCTAPTLKHITRCAIRAALNTSLNNVPALIEQLPLPRLIKDYVDLQFD